MTSHNKNLEDSRNAPVYQSDEAQVTEAHEIMAYLPEYDGKVVILIGDEARRCASVVAERAAQVVTIDPCELCNHPAYTQSKNVCVNDFRHIRIVENSADLLVFHHHVCLDKTDRLFFLTEALSWIRENGYIFFLHSVAPDKENNEDIYLEELSSVTSAASASLSVHVFGLDIVLIKHLKKQPQSVGKSGRSKKIIWLLQKVKRQLKKGQICASLQETLNNQLYTKIRIRQLERIFGTTFVSAGGLTATKEFLKKLNLREGQRVLDVGCGLGGNSFYMAKEFRVSVVAMDLSSNMIDIAMMRAKELGIKEEEVDFEVADARKREYKAGHFDVIFSRDTILHISDKLHLFKKFKKFLKPGGKVLISDYCCSEGEHTQHFKDYVKTFGYNILSQREYCSTLREAGFINIESENKTDLFIKTTTRELDRLIAQKKDYIEEFSEEDFEAFSTMWRNTQKCAAVGDQILGLFYAEKPSLV